MSSNNSKSFKKLTKHQREILDLLNQGYMIEIDKYNMSSICGLNISSQTRYFLTMNRYISRKDKTKSVETKGNGFIITDKGKKVLEFNSFSMNIINASAVKNSLIERIELNAERISKDQLSEIKWYVISVVKSILKRKWDSPNQIDLADDKVDLIVNQLSYDEQVLKSINHELQFLIGHCSKSEFIKFGEYTDNDGFTHVGASKNSIAYNKTKELLNSEFQ